MNRTEQKIMWRLSRGPALIAEVAVDTGLRARTTTIALLALQELGWVRRSGQAWKLTNPGREALWEALWEERSWMERTVCPACFRIRGPIHWLAGLLGGCEGVQEPPPVPPPPPLTYVVAPTHRDAQYFVRWTQEDPQLFKIVEQPIQLRGLAQGVDVVFIDGNWPVGSETKQMMIEYLAMLRAKVRYTNLDRLSFGGSREDDPGP